MLIVLHHLWVRPCSLPRRRSVGLTLSRDDDDDDGDVEIKKSGDNLDKPQDLPVTAKGKVASILIC